MSGWNAFEVDREFVVANFKKGFFDYVEAACHVTETQFFRWLIGKRLLDRLAATYPSPRHKEEVPLWLYLSSELTLRLHGATGFSALPYILHCGGLKDALGPEQATMVKDAQTDEYHLRFQGYNNKNVYPRITPCDQDFVRKLARDTPATELEYWFGQTLPDVYHRMHTFDSEGIFLIDGSYLFVPDNEHYENSSIMRFDEHNHPLSEQDYEALSVPEKRRCAFRRCYRTVTLLHTNRTKSYYLYCGLRVFKGKGAETPHMRPLVDSFVKSVGKGKMKWMIFDRGFIDGETIAYLKTQHQINSVFPLKRTMNLYDEAKRLAAIDPNPPVVWRPPIKVPPSLEDKPAVIRKRELARRKKLEEKKAQAESVAPKVTVKEVRLRLIPGIKIWDSCPLPMQIVLLEEHLTDGSCSEWALATTAALTDPLELWHLYQVRPAIEERHRQLKCFWDLTSFRSTSFALVVNQVAFILLAYSLMQIFLLKIDKEELTTATRERLLERLLPMGRKVFLYYQNRVGTLSPLEHQHLVLTLDEGPRRRILGKTKSLLKAELGLE